MQARSHECTEAFESSFHYGLSSGPLLQISWFHFGQRCPVAKGEIQKQLLPAHLVLCMMLNCPEKKKKPARKEAKGWMQSWRRVRRSCRWTFSCSLSFSNSHGSVSVFQDTLKFELGKEEFFHRLLLYFFFCCHDNINSFY